MEVMKITLESTHDSTQWDTLLAKTSYGTIFHTWKWLKIVEKHTKTKLYPIIGFKGTNPIGIFPIFYQKKGFFKLILSPPYKTALVYLGPLIIDYENMKQGKRESTLFEFLKAADKFFLSNLEGNYLRITSAPGLFDSRPFLWKGYKVETLYTLDVDLTKSSDALWESFDKILRKNINGSLERGISVEKGSLNDMDFIFDLVTKRLEERGIQVNTIDSAFHPDKSYLHDIYNSFYPQNLKVFIARYKGERIGGLLALSYNNRAMAWIGTPKINMKNVYPNDLIHWEAIKWAKENGFQCYEIMDSGYSQPLCDYKSQFSPSPSIYFSCTKYSSNIARIARVVHRKLRKNEIL